MSDIKVNEAKQSKLSPKIVQVPKNCLSLNLSSQTEPGPGSVVTFSILYVVKPHLASKLLAVCTNVFCLFSDLVCKTECASRSMNLKEVICISKYQPSSDVNHSSALIASLHTGMEI